MLGVEQQRFQLPRDQISMDSVPTIHNMNDSEVHNHTQKQQIKNNSLSTYKILLGIAVLFIAAMVGYKVYNELATPANKSQIDSVHGKIIQYADSSSSKDKTSTSGSSSSKSSKNNQKPNLASKPASKTPISSNNMNSGSDDGGQDEDQNDGHKNKKILDDGKTVSQTKSSKFTVATTQDSDQVEEDDQDVFTSQGLMFNDNEDGPAPLIGSTRG